MRLGMRIREWCVGGMVSRRAIGSFTMLSVHGLLIECCGDVL